MWRLRTLASQILLGVLCVLIVTMAVGALLYVRLSRHDLDRQYEDRARAQANTVASFPDVARAVAAGDPRHELQPLAQRLIARSGASYIVITDRTGLRFSHPNPRLIGQRLEEPVAVLDGHDHVGIDHGSLGRSANGKAAVFDSSGTVIGQVSVGILETEVATRAHALARAIALYSALALGVGTVGALLMARAFKRMTFGLELREIAALLQEREAMLHGIHEGVIGFDARGRVQLINTEARRLLGIASRAIGQPLEELIGPGRLRRVLAGELDGADQTVITDDALLVVNRKPAIVAGRNVGSVVTLRDRTELEGLVRRMNAVSGLTDALRAQEHEFVNRLHVIAGLLDLGELEEARSYLSVLSQDQLAPAENLRARVAPPVVAALLVAKQAVCTERGVELSVTSDSYLDAPEALALTLMTILGNLIDNAVDSVAGQNAPRTVTVEIRSDADIVVLVTDNGPGVAAADVPRIFTDGYSTKPPRGQMRRGIGLALVRRLVHRAGGTIEVTPGPGGRFQVRLPLTPAVDFAVGDARELVRGEARP